jgi:hypothetical protein
MDEACVAHRIDTSMMTGGDGVETQDVSALAEPVELEVAIALDARVRRQTLGVSAHVWIDDVGVEVVGEVEHQMIDVELLSYAAGVVDIGHRAAAGVALSTPQPHRDADHVVAGVDQLGGGDR